MSQSYLDSYICNFYYISSSVSVVHSTQFGIHITLNKMSPKILFFSSLSSAADTFHAECMVLYVHFFSLMSWTSGNERHGCHKLTKVARFCVSIYQGRSKMLHIYFCTSVICVILILHDTFYLCVFQYGLYDWFV